MKKVVVFNDHWCSGGVESLWTNIINSIGVNNKVRFIILATQKETDIYDSILNKNNVKLITVLDKIISNPIKRTKENIKRIKMKLKEINPDILHINSCNASGLKIAYVAKKIGIKNIIVHSHNTRIENDKFKIKKFAHLYWRRKYLNAPTNYFACSTEAAEFMFTNKNVNKVYLLKNGVDTTKFDFNLEIRNEVRKTNQIDSCFIIGHVGRYSDQKNHRFLIEIFNEVHKLDNSAKLMLIGEGELKKEIFDLINLYNLNEYVIDVGVTKDVYKYLNAMDLFMLPSLHEGLPVVAVEAQASGLPVIMASTITKEASILPTTKYLDLNENPKVWAKVILEYKNYIRTSAKLQIENSGFDIVKESNRLLDFYEKM